MSIPIDQKKEILRMVKNLKNENFARAKENLSNLVNLKLGEKIKLANNNVKTK